MNTITLGDIKRNKDNKIFFDNASFHGDTGYKIRKGGNIFEVETSHGTVKYELHQETIGDCIR